VVGNGEGRVSEHKFSARAGFGTKWQHSSLLDAPGVSFNNWLATPTAILAHFHPLLWLAEAFCFNRLVFVYDAGEWGYGIGERM
jgi:hypothetical protein